MANSKAMLILSVFAMALTGCKVTATDSYHHPDSDDFISGLFFDARDTGRHFPTSSWSLTSATEACRNESLYFETDSSRVRVYGSPAYSETSFRAAASELERRIDGVLSRFQLRWPDFVEDRSAAAPYPRQVIGCLSPNVPSSEFVSASMTAVAFNPYYGQWPYETSQIVSHELAHFVQENLSRYDSSYTLLPYWFAEGQAVVVAGEPIAPAYQHFDYDPLRDVTTDDAARTPYRFEHYGLAYRYLEKANGALAMTVLLEMAQLLDWDGGFYGEISTGESRAFVEAFNSASLVDHRNNYLSFQRFRSDYHDLLNSSY
ncbi:hypothetical protein FMN52_17735 [Marinobacter sp. BW6]|uniref:hypothetical protein n=1 Tax=Marinobacter sp. BW6 TaxID=2592624 RepID=UPI0011DE6969|nr:hypothetical protein [Marinobacter sp. BW6]TYC55510.1 hypothetical protein FMN52_17735 [Marinobacter sp. BW6]